MNTPCVARIASLGSVLGIESIDDQTQALALGVDLEKVTALSRGRLRGEAPDGTGNVDLSKQCVGPLLERAGVSAEGLDFIVFATTTNDRFFPGSACLLQAELGAPTIACLDVRSQCAGFLTALDIARRMVMVGRARRVLTVAAELPSHVNRRDGKELELACMMTDAAAAVLVEGVSVELADSTPSGRVLSCRLGVDGSRQKDYWCEFPASRHCDPDLPFHEQSRVPQHAIDAGGHFPHADIAGMHDTALRYCPGSFRDALADAGLSSVDATLIAHLNPDTEQALTEALGAASGRSIVADTLYGGAAALPTLLDRARAEGRIQPGETVAMVTAGGGATWGTAVIEVPA
jgi:3-oxoacyl-[acyl-carrier-protein] synthase-3